MIKFSYLTDWNTALHTQPTHLDRESVPPLLALQTNLLQYAFAHKDISEFFSSLFQYAMNQFYYDHSLTGLFRLLKYTSQNHISPFIASQNYCIKVNTVSSDGTYTFTISPIYYLGPEYPDDHAARTGSALEQSAIIGLIRSSDNLNEPATFNLGIDAGIAFKHADISHNKTMTLGLQTADEGIVANLACEGHLTTKVLTWEHFGISPVELRPVFEPLANFS